MIIILKGSAGSGKDTLANYIATKYNFKKLAFADPLKEIVSIISGWNIELVKGDTKESRIFRETEKHEDFNLTCRQMLQKVGTDVFRYNFDDKIWIKILLKKLNNEDKFIITDCRFKNEFLDIKDKYDNVFIVHIDRTTNNNISNHVSENIPYFDEELKINNNGTIDDLFKSFDEEISNKIFK